MRFHCCPSRANLFHDKLPDNRRSHRCGCRWLAGTQLHCFQFNRQIGNAFARVQFKRRSDGIRRTGGDTIGAVAAMIFLRRVGFQFQRGDDFSQKIQLPNLRLIRFVCLPTRSRVRALREIAFQAGVHIPERACACAAELVHEWPAISIVRRGCRGSHQTARNGRRRRCVNRIVNRESDFS